LSPSFEEPANAGMVRSGTRKRANTAFFMIILLEAGTVAVPVLDRMRAGIPEVCIE
jgi:hypothetical protein